MYGWEGWCHVMCVWEGLVSCDVCVGGVGAM